MYGWCIGDAGSRYMVVDCGGGTVDITVHEMENESPGNLRELYKAAGGPHGSIGMPLLYTLRDSSFYVFLLFLISLKLLSF